MRGTHVEDKLLPRGLKGHLTSPGSLPTGARALSHVEVHSGRWLRAQIYVEDLGWELMASGVSEPPCTMSEELGQK